MPKKKMQKMWGGRFNGDIADVAARMNLSLDFDRRLWRQDIAGSKAWAQAIAEIGILSDTELRTIHDGLDKIEKEFEDGTFDLRPEHEDIHMNIEARLTELAGDAGKKLHTGRSRNDQVVTDVRLYVRESIDRIVARIVDLLHVLTDLAAQHAGDPMPGYTHMQRAQPVTLGHHLLAYAEMLLRDRTRFLAARRHVNVLPLGSGALAGTAFPVDRAKLAHALGFEAVSENSIDAVASRDFATETMFAAVQMLVHLSRFGEELVIWSTTEFGFVRISDGFSTGSSMMPQKRNPDIAELLRAKPARALGDLVAVITAVKGLPLAYNKDLQEDKEPLFDSLDTAELAVEATAAMLREAVWNVGRMASSLRHGHVVATDVADALAWHGTPFRKAHEMVGKFVADMDKHGKDITDASNEILKEHFGDQAEVVRSSLDLTFSLDRRSVAGGTAPATVRSRAKVIASLLGG